MVLKLSKSTYWEYKLLKERRKYDVTFKQKAAYTLAGAVAFANVFYGVPSLTTVSAEESGQYVEANDGDYTAEAYTPGTAESQSTSTSVSTSANKKKSTSAKKKAAAKKKKAAATKKRAAAKKKAAAAKKKAAAKKRAAARKKNRRK